MGKSMKLVVATVAVMIASPVLATDFTVTGTYSDGTTRFLKVATGDLDGDGANDDGVLRLACSNGAITSAWIYAPRDSATGMTTGKRMHKPFTMVKEWGAASPQIFQRTGGYTIEASKKGYDYYKTQNGGRAGKTMAMDDWQSISITGMAGVCASSPADKANMQDLSFTK